jgi:hypothetical protein
MHWQKQYFWLKIQLLTASAPPLSDAREKAETAGKIFFVHYNNKLNLPIPSPKNHSFSIESP